MKKPNDGTKNICVNRKARHEYKIEDVFEAGLVLKGSEVKSLRTGRVHLNEAYVAIVNDEAWLVQANISPYSHASHFNHEADRRRKLLLHRQELRKLRVRAREKGYTLVPMRLYFKDGIAKLEFGIGQGKKMHDKRHALKAADAKREMDRAKKQYR